MRLHSSLRNPWEKGTFPEVKKRRKKQSSFDTFAPYVLSRWQKGVKNGLVLWREIKEQGYTGSD